MKLVFGCVRLSEQGRRASSAYPCRNPDRANRRCGPANSFVKTFVIPQRTASTFFVGLHYFRACLNLEFYLATGINSSRGRTKKLLILFFFRPHSYTKEEDCS